MNEYGLPLSYEQFCERFNFQPHFTTFYGIQRNITKILNEFDHVYFICNIPNYPKFLHIARKNVKGCKMFYDIFIKSRYNRPISEIKWDTKLNLGFDQVWWKKVNTLIPKVTKDVKLRWLQFRIVHRILSTNSYLFRIGILTSDVCSFCSETIETIEHIFWRCPFVYDFWNNLQNWVNSTIDIPQIHLTECDVIFGIAETSKVLNLVLLLAKKHIYRQKLKMLSPSLEAFKREFRYYKDICKYIYRKNNQEGVYIKYWGKYANLN